MKPDTRLDSALFQLTPTRTRYSLDPCDVCVSVRWKLVMVWFREGFRVLSRRIFGLRGFLEALHKFQVCVCLFLCLFVKISLKKGRASSCF